MATRQEFVRFTLAQRFEHWLLVISFTVLAVTGLPQKFVGDPTAETVIAWMGGIESVRSIHHIAAIVLLLELVYHFVSLGYKIVVQRTRWTMLPGLQDVFDALNTALYNLGVRKLAPKFDRYSFGEKFEYWALIWGTVIMAFTGFVLWNPILTSQILPGQIVPAAKAAHGGEALLAVLAILVWHFYNVHIKVLNKSIFTGKLSEHEMKEEHALELERIETKTPDPARAPAAIQQRQRVYVPIALVLCAVLLFGVYLFATAETTAVVTVPRVTMQAFVPFTRTPTATFTLTLTPSPLPTSTSTHTPVPTDTPTPVPTNTPTVPAGQPTFTPAPATATRPAPTATQVAPTAAPAVATSQPAQAAPPIPADHAGRTTCQVCHALGVGSAPKNPADHAGRLDASCKDCHQGP